MSLLDIYKAKKLGISAGSLFYALTGKKLSPVESFNKWDEEWELGTIDGDTGQNAGGSGTGAIRTKNYIPVKPDTLYYINTGKYRYVLGYDDNKDFIGRLSEKSAGDGGYLITVPQGCYYIRVPFAPSYGTTYNHDICINISTTEGSPKNGDYVPYKG